jgi:hypothetical protein
MIQWLMDLQIQATARGGNVGASFGNGEAYLFQLNYRNLSPMDIMSFAASSENQLSRDPRRSEAHLELVFNGMADEVSWLRSLPLFLYDAGSRSYVLHGGMTERMLKKSPNQWNEIFYDALQRLNEGRSLSDDQEYLLSEEGPLHSQTMALAKRKSDLKNGKKGVTKKELRKYLRDHGADRLIIGHVPTTRGGDGEIILKHPYYDELVIRIDTGISHEDGRISALEISKGVARAHYLKRDKFLPELASQQLGRCFFHLAILLQR